LSSAALILPALLGACSGSDKVGSMAEAQSNETRGLAGASDERPAALPTNREIITLRDAPNPERNAYFGDLHVHTAYSFDAYAFGTTASPDDAYRYARGEALDHPSGYQVQLQQPLDFYAVTDHAMFLGLVKEAADTSTAFSRYEVAEPLHDINAPNNMSITSLGQRGRTFASFVPATLSGLRDGEIDIAITEAVAKSAWKDSVRAAEDAYVPGTFTTFAAFEYTSSTDKRGNLHRNVIFKNSDRLPAVPFSRLNSQNPEGLWDWMDGLRDQGIESLAIPHNSNGSNGQMFKLVDWAGNPLDSDYADQRLRNEPLVEVTQVKGTSETHPLLSKNDEWADFEIAPYRVGTKLYSEPSGSYVREAYLHGLKLSAEAGINPYRFGLVGASDTHTGAASLDEENFFSKAGMLDGTPELRGSVPASFLYGAVLRLLDPGLLTEVEGTSYIEGSSFESWSASGLAVVWAEENTRESIYEAFRRKETFATSGPRIKLRFFAGSGLDELALDNPDLVKQAYAGGVPMGGDIATAAGREPTFLVWASADANGAPLQRAQVIKGSIVDGEHREQVFDVACSDGLAVDPQTHRCPDNGAGVDPTDCSISADSGAGELKALWRDPEFDPAAEAFYYLRVLENPVCRWSTWDALRAGVDPRPDLPATIQERAWSSPIWYRPGNADSADTVGESDYE
jgi:hypothetical protein